MNNNKGVSISSGELLELREALAEFAHDSWSGWMKYLVSKLRFGSQRGMHGPGEVQMWLSNGLRHRWNRQMSTRYEDLPESEKDSDRAEADKVLKILEDKGILRL